MRYRYITKTDWTLKIGQLPQNYQMSVYSHTEDILSNANGKGADATPSRPLSFNAEAAAQHIVGRSLWNSLHCSFQLTVLELNKNYHWLQSSQFKLLYVAGQWLQAIIRALHHLRPELILEAEADSDTSGRPELRHRPPLETDRRALQPCRVDG